MTKTLQGVLTGMFENEKSDAITLDRNTKVILKKGLGRSVLSFKGKRVEVNATESEFNGKTVYRAELTDIKVLDGGASPTSMSSSPNTGYSTGYQDKQKSIVFQSMAKVAIEACIHNAAMGKREVTPQEVIQWTYQLIGDALNPEGGNTDL